MSDDWEVVNTKQKKQQKNQKRKEDKEAQKKRYLYLYLPRSTKIPNIN